ncbi:hypothetical protein [Streptomyces albidoflavus]|uniref:hypothetical protein n=1 Tax=Streptomyces albidoflavus TaxID=1886 RepID=UPI0018A0B70A|nr:hypothetical protein [Streptomyces albidoflavus]MBL0776443.1 hypothetical protein [Streptomyces albidoflavus]MCR0988369.1 hypothetical protein [Streptomyces albidoflavus]WTC02844.1 hypothetical protein OG794_13885 [Streptomyces albidoflavus]
MRIYRSAPKRSFTSLPNATTRDKHLSWAAMGILSYLLGLPDGSRTSVRQLAGLRAEGRDRVAAALRQLEEFRYLRRVRRQGPTGRFTTDYEVFDVPYVDEPDASAEPGVASLGEVCVAVSGNPASGGPAVGAPGPTLTGKTGSTRPPTLGVPSPGADGPQAPDAGCGERRPKRRRATREAAEEQVPAGRLAAARAESAVTLPGPRAPLDDRPAEPAETATQTPPTPTATGPVTSPPPPEPSGAPPIVWETSEAAEGEVPPPDPADAPQRPRREEPLTGSAEVLSRLGQRDRRLTLGADEARQLAPLLDEWFAVGADEASVFHALTSGLPSRVHAAAALVADRLRRKKPAPRAPKPRPASRPRCVNCRANMFQPGLCNACVRERDRYGDLPPDPTDYSVTPETAARGAAAVRAAFHVNGPARGSQLRGVPLPGPGVTPAW